MKKAPALLLATLALLSSVTASAEDIILRLRPDASAPAITRIIATDKVLLEAAPAGENSDWRKLDLKVPVEGYVPAATLTKSFAIVQDTPVHFLPNASSDTITRVQDGDVYEIKRVKDEWATIGLNKKLTTYFQAAAIPTTAPTLAPSAPQLQLLPEPPILDLTPTEPAPVSKSKSTSFDPTLSVGITAPEQLPPENVIWESASSVPSYATEPEPQTVTSPPEPPLLPEGIMVSSIDTQAREARTKTPPTADKPHRLLTGILVREIETTGPAYPIRLKSLDGRLIAYVDFSELFVEDLSPYLDQRVILRGQIGSIREGSRDLVIFVHQILPAN